MPEPGRGEVWLVDLGLVAKIRPCLVLSVPATGPNDRALVTLVAHTTSPRGTAYEVPVPVRFLKPGVFDAQNLVTVPHAKLVRRMGILNSEQLAEVMNAIRRWLELQLVHGCSFACSINCVRKPPSDEIDPFAARLPSGTGNTLTCLP